MPGRTRGSRAMSCRPSAGRRRCAGGRTRATPVNAASPPVPGRSSGYVEPRRVPRSPVPPLEDCRGTLQRRVSRKTGEQPAVTDAEPIGIRYARQRAREPGIERASLLIFFDRPGKPARRPFREIVVAAQEVLVRVRAGRRTITQGAPFSGRQLARNGRRHLLRHVILERKKGFGGSFVRLSPRAKAGLGIDKSCDDPHSARRAPHTSFYDVANCHFPANRDAVVRRSLTQPARTLAAHLLHLQATYIPESGRNLLRQAVGEVCITRIGGEIVEVQYADAQVGRRVPAAGVPHEPAPECRNAEDDGRRGTHAPRGHRTPVAGRERIDEGPNGCGTVRRRFGQPGE